MEKIKLSTIRSQFPMYGDLNDDQLLIALRKKFYSDIPPAQFYNRIDYDTQRVDPTAGMSTTEKVLAGAGKSMMDIVRSGKRVANMVGIGDYDEAAAKADQDLDKSLMDTTAGKVGKYGTDIALTFVPGLKGQKILTEGVKTGARVLPRAAQATAQAAAPYIGAAGSGAVLGAITSPEDMGEGAQMGALAGAAGEAGGRVLSAAYKGGKAVFEPLTEEGRNRVLKRTLERFATDPNKLRDPALMPSDVTVPGRMPQLAPGTLAEATLDPGIAQLQRAAASASPDVASALAEARGRQVAGYKGILDELAGNDGKREFFDAARESAANQLYRGAEAGGLNMTTQLEGQMAELMKRPSVKTAVQQARNLAAEKGINITGKEGSVQGLHYVKKSLDDMIGAAKRAGNNNEASALIETQQNLLDFLRRASPGYGEAMDTYRAMSRPINQMDIGQTLRDKAIPALSDLSNGSLARVNASSYANALRNADATAARATGMRGAKMANVLDPDQLRAVESIGEDMARYATSQELGRVPGSPTAQYLGAQNVIRQFLGPLGIPQSAADTMIGRITTGLLSFPFKLTQSQTEQLLARALTEPGVAAKIMSTTDPKTIAEMLQPYMAQLSVQGQIQ
jgi:hypothetical protein